MDRGWIVTLPIKTKSALNLREHWGAKARRAKIQRNVVRLLWPWAWRSRTWTLPIEVTLTRLYPPRGKSLDRFDNLPASMKAIVDQVCKELGVDDADERITFKVLQERGTDWGVRVELREGGR